LSLFVQVPEIREQIFIAYPTGALGNRPHNVLLEIVCAI